MLCVAVKLLVICYSSKKRRRYTILWEIKYKVLCVTEQLLILCWGKGKDEGAMKASGGSEGGLGLFFKFFWLQSTGVGKPDSGTQ